MSRLEEAWNFIHDQIGTYLAVQSLTGMERIQAVNKLMTGYQKLMDDMSYFEANAPANDPRREAAANVKMHMEKLHKG